jgi:nitrite reductase/ring-hydroxylating ferredoxin subunit
VRTAEGGINALVNRCAHKGSMIYYRPSGHMSELTCPITTGSTILPATSKASPSAMVSADKAACRPG